MNARKVGVVIYCTNTIETILTVLAWVIGNLAVKLYREGIFRMISAMIRQNENQMPGKHPYRPFEISPHLKGTVLREERE